MRTRAPGSGTRSASKNTEIVLTVVRIVVRWSTPEGIQAACCGGKRKWAVAVSTSTVPWKAYSSWCRSWACQVVISSSPS